MAWKCFRESQEPCAQREAADVVHESQPLTFNQFGGSLGGPIRKDKIFLFGDYEGYREREGVFVQGNVPTDSLRAQLQAAVPAYKMTLDAFPSPNQPVAPNATVGLYSAAQAGQRNDDHFDAKGDVLFTSNSRLAVTYNHGIANPAWFRRFIWTTTVLG